MQQYVIPMLTSSICQMTALRCTGQQEAGQGEGQWPNVGLLLRCNSWYRSCCSRCCCCYCCAALRKAVQPQGSTALVFSSGDNAVQPSDAAPGAGKAVVHDKVDCRAHDCASVVKRVQRQEVRQAVEACSRCSSKSVVDCTRWRQRKQSGGLWCNLLAHRRIRQSLHCQSRGSQSIAAGLSRPTGRCTSHPPEADSR